MKIDTENKTYNNYLMDLTFRHYINLGIITNYIGKITEKINNINYTIIMFIT